MSAITPVSTSVIHVPLHHTAAKLVLEAKHEVTSNFDINKATKKLKEAYTLGQTILAEINMRAPPNLPPMPINVVFSLVNLLSMDEIQCEDSFKFEVAKTCKIYLAIAYKVFRKTGREIYLTTYDEMIKKIENVLSIPSEDPKIEYELECSKSIAWAMNEITTHAKDYIKKSVGDATAAFFDYSRLPILLKKMGKMLKQSWETIWFYRVYKLDLKSRALMENNNLSTVQKLDEFYQYYQKKKGIAYTGSWVVASCVLEHLTKVMDMAVKDKDITLQLRLLKGDDQKDEPGISHLAKIINNFNMEEFWRTRSQTMLYLFDLLKNPKVKKQTWTIIVKLIVEAARTEKKHDNLLTIYRCFLSLKNEAMQNPKLKWKIRRLRKERFSIPRNRAIDKDIQDTLMDKQFLKINQVEQTASSLLTLTPSSQPTNLNPQIEVNAPINNLILMQKLENSSIPAEQNETSEDKKTSKKRKRLDEIHNETLNINTQTSKKQKILSETGKEALKSTNEEATD